MQNWLQMSASDLGRAIGAGQIDPVELTQAYFQQIKTHPLSMRIYARLCEERALAEAEAAAERAKAQQRLSLLDGVPISWKDLFDTAHDVTEAGSHLLKDRVPLKDARVLINATAHGLVCLGKTHMSELAFSGLGLNPVTETPPCVNDLDAVPGGSSSGAAASVAFQMAAAGIGSDTGGSVRIPAAWNDLVGLKTTAGLLSLEGVVPLARDFDTVGPLTRSVEDAARLLGVMIGGGPADLKGSNLKGSRFAVMRSVMMEQMREQPLKAFEMALETLKNAGAQVEEIESPVVQEALDLSGAVVVPQAYGEWKALIEANPDVMYPEILARFRNGAKQNAADYVAAWHRLHELRAQYLAQTSGFDAVLAPTSAIMPPNVNRLNEDSAYYVRENLLALRNTRIGNMLGLCSLSVPTGAPSCGLMLMMSPHQEGRLLRTGAAIEAVLTK